MKDEIKILFIGNSFAVDTTDQVALILKSLGAKKVKLMTLFVGGCSIRKHFHHLVNDLKVYEAFVNEGNGWDVKKYYSIKQAIKEENWDYIGIQHGSADGSRYADLYYYQLLPTLVKKVKQLANTQAKIIFNMTWVGEVKCNHHEILAYNNDTRKLYNDIASLTCKHIVTNGDIDIVVPTGTAIENARTSYVSSLNRDGYHLSLDLGRYIAGLLFVKTLLNVDVNNIEYVPEGMDNKLKAIALESVNNAFVNPFEVTSSKYSKE